MKFVPLFWSPSLNVEPLKFWLIWGSFRRTFVNDCLWVIKWSYKKNIESKNQFIIFRCLRFFSMKYCLKSWLKSTYISNLNWLRWWTICNRINRVGVIVNRAVVTWRYHHCRPQRRRNVTLELVSLLYTGSTIIWNDINIISIKISIIGVGISYT